MSDGSPDNVSGSDIDQYGGMMAPMLERFKSRFACGGYQAHKIERDPFRMPLVWPGLVVGR